MNAPDNATSASDRPVGLAILGSTGSIGRQTLDVVSHYGNRFRVVALAAGSNVETLCGQIAVFQPDLVAVDCDPSACHPPLNHRNLVRGQEGLFAAATHPEVDLVVVATSGHAAMAPTAAAIRAGKTIALANKETVVCAGELIIPLARECGVEIRPVDSEHSAIWQSLGAANRSDIAQLILTASGGPFRKTPPAELARVTVAQALSHPTWSMGGKITIDSATLMNKGLEVIEARWLFDVDYDKIDVLIHPESIVHSLVEFQDGSQIAQLSLPDMRLPIQYALTYPRHEPGPCRRLSLAEIGALHFEKPDLGRFPALKLAREAGKAGLTYPTVLSAADDIAVEAFVQGKISFRAIIDIVARTLDRHSPERPLSWDSIAAADRWARETATRLIPTVDQAVG
jgi:1-deoxy-D-xylulose-5-phosphate reductoisomerase